MNLTVNSAVFCKVQLVHYTTVQKWTEPFSFFACTFNFYEALDGFPLVRALNSETFYIDSSFDQSCVLRFVFFALLCLKQANKQLYISAHTTRYAKPTITQTDMLAVQLKKNACSHAHSV
jgi:hypothetical protein